MGKSRIRVRDLHPDDAGENYSAGANANPEFTRQFWCETWQDCEWKPGASWRLMAPDGRVGDSGEVLEIEPGRSSACPIMEAAMNPNPELRAEGLFEADLRARKTGRDLVKLTVVHEIDKPGSKFIEGVSGGWPPILAPASKKSLLETGEPLEVSRRWPKVYKGATRQKTL